MFDDLSLFFLNSLIHLTLYSVFICYAQQKFVVTLTLADQLIRIINRVELQQWEKPVSELECRLNRGRTFDWRRKHKLSRFLKEWCKGRKDTEQKRFIISILILNWEELKNFLSAEIEDSFKISFFEGLRFTFFLTMMQNLTAADTDSLYLLQVSLQWGASELSSLTVTLSFNLMMCTQSLNFTLEETFAHLLKETADIFSTAFWW